ncbi:MAG TPA: hypothetical protein VGG35_04935 [Streptosporangiaceae bacterium]
MAAFRGADWTGLAYRVRGAGPPLACLAGGPMRERPTSVTWAGCPRGTS